MDNDTPSAAKPDSSGKAPGRSPLFLISIVVLIIIVCIAGWFLLTAKPGSGQAQTATTPSSPAAAPSGGAQQPAPVATVAAAFPPGSLEANGIWVRITYPGSYKGTLSAQGWGSDVNGAGNRMIKVPVQNTIITGSVTKQDDSADLLNIEVFNGGKLVSGSSTSAPHGTATVHITVSAAVVSTPTPVSAPVPAASTAAA